MKSQSIFTGITMLMTCSIIQSKPNSSLIILMSFLLGSLFTLLMCYVFSSVADVWYAIGSGQWQMVSLDTAGSMLYFICPGTILYLRFLEKYGEFIASKCTIFKELLQPTGLLKNGGFDGKDVLPLSLVMSLATITVVGVPLLNALCPIGGY